jgi:hypothetical protein
MSRKSSHLTFGNTMVAITNISAGIVMLDSLASALIPGQTLDLEGSWVDNTIKYPELSIFLDRGRIAMRESTPELLNGDSDEH